jgi:glutathione S-transferase
MESYWLSKTPYLNGDKPTIADISCACELFQMKAIDLDLVKEGYPKVNAWFERMMEIPEMKEVHTGVLEQLRQVKNVME